MYWLIMCDGYCVLLMYQIYLITLHVQMRKASKIRSWIKKFTPSAGTYKYGKNHWRQIDVISCATFARKRNFPVVSPERLRQY